MLSIILLHTYIIIHYSPIMLFHKIDFLPFLLSIISPVEYHYTYFILNIMPSSVDSTFSSFLYTSIFLFFVLFFPPPSVQACEFLSWVNLLTYIFSSHNNTLVSERTLPMFSFYIICGNHFLLEIAKLLFDVTNQWFTWSLK